MSHTSKCNRLFTLDGFKNVTIALSTAFGTGNAGNSLIQSLKYHRVGFLFLFFIYRGVNSVGYIPGE